MRSSQQKKENDYGLLFDKLGQFEKNEGVKTKQ